MSHTEFIAIAEEGVVLLMKLRDKYPHLVTPSVEEAINNWNTQFTTGLKETQMALEMERAEREALARLAAELLKTHQLEDVLKLLSDEYSLSIDYEQLIDLIGKDAYMGALYREAALLEENAISREQIAHLWNGMGKPALGGEKWTQSEISALIQSVASKQN